MTTRQDTITGYLTDMLALEQHLATALAAQVRDFKDRTEIADGVQTIQKTCERHKDALDALSGRRTVGAQGAMSTVKKAAASVLGAGAAAIDFVRSDKLPKSLRDDYAAVSLACISYVMLQTTASALDDDEVAVMAYQHLVAHTQSAASLQAIIPVAIVELLRADGHTVDTAILGDMERSIKSASHFRDGASQPTLALP